MKPGVKNKQKTTTEYIEEVKKPTLPAIAAYYLKLLKLILLPVQCFLVLLLTLAPTSSFKWSKELNSDDLKSINLGIGATAAAGVSGNRAGAVSKAHCFVTIKCSQNTQAGSELRSCVKVEVDVPNSRYGFCGRKATLNNRAQELCESGGGCP